MIVATLYPVDVLRMAAIKARTAMDVILHVGAHLTGVSTLSSYLERNRWAFSARGLAVWTPTQTRHGLFDGLTLKSGLPRVSKRRVRGTGRLRLRSILLERAGVRELLVVEPAMIGSVFNNVTAERLYPAVGERAARMAHGFGGRVRRVVLTIRAYEDFWAASLAHALKNGAMVPDQAQLDHLVTQPRSWRHVVSDLACAVPGAEILVAPFERLGDRPCQMVEFSVAGRFSAPPYDQLGELRQVPSLPVLRQVLEDRQMPMELLPEGAGRWQPFDAAQIATFKEIYAEDISWLRAGADGLAYLIQEITPDHAGFAPRAGE